MDGTDHSKLSSRSTWMVPTMCRKIVLASSNRAQPFDTIDLSNSAHDNTTEKEKRDMRWFIKVRETQHEIVEYYNAQFIGETEESALFRVDIDPEWSVYEEHPDYLMILIREDGSVTITDYSWSGDVNDYQLDDTRHSTVMEVKMNI